MLAHMIALFLVLYGLFSIVAASIYIPTNSVGGSLFSTASPTFIVCRHFNDRHSDQCGLICISLISSDVEYFFYVFFAHLYVFFGEMSI